MSKLNLSRFTLKKFIALAFLCLAFIIIFKKGDVSFNKDPKSKVIINRLEFNRDPENYNAKLQIIDEKNNEVAQFNIAIADSSKKKLQGLMNLESLPQNQGMIFLFDESQIIAMWMKNTLIPLDMIFIDENNIIVNIKTNTIPHSLDIISSVKNITKVLEINAGIVEKLGIKVGQKIVIPQLNQLIIEAEVFDENIENLSKLPKEPEHITK